MHLHKSRKEDNQKPTCKTHCLFFDEKTNKCAYYNQEVPNDPFHTMSCDEFVAEDEWKEFSDELLLNEQEKKTTSSYPYVPLEDSGREDAIWFVSPDQKFGCWIIYLSENKRLMSVDTIQKDVKTIRSGKYHSPYPLHDHGYGPEVASQVAWVVDQEGQGQYAWLLAGDILFIN